MLGDRFWSKVDKSGDCWTWTAAIGKKGYGYYFLDGRLVLAHRAAWEENQKARLRECTQVDHSCFNRSCINPDHLFEVTGKQNQENRSGATRRSKTGVRGVSWYEPYGKYRARVGHNGKSITVGYFSDVRDAESAAVAKRLELHTNNRKDRNA